MLKKIARLTVCCSISLVVLNLAYGVMIGAEKDSMSISEIMKKGHTKNGALSKVKAGLKAKDWDAVKAATKDLKTFGEHLGANKPPKGSAESWKKFSEAYKKGTADAAAAAEKEDAKGVNAGLTAVANCKGCHNAHK